MTKDEILTQLNDVFIDVMDLDEIHLSEETTAADVDEWDSLSHFRLMIAVERKFGLRFSGSEISGLQKVGDLVDLIIKKKTSA